MRNKVKFFLFLCAVWQIKKRKIKTFIWFFFYKHISLHGWSFINLWFRNVTWNARDVHRCQVNIWLRRCFFFFSWPLLLPLAEFFQTAGMFFCLFFFNMFLFYSFLSRRFTEGHKEHWLTDSMEACKMSTCMIYLIQISKTLMDLFRRDSTW